MSRRNLTIIGILVLMGITSVVSILGYTYFIGGSGNPSQPISAPTLSLENPTANPAEAQIEALSTQVAELQAQNATLIAGAANAGSSTLPPTAEATQDTAVETTSEAVSAPAASTLFRIVPDESEVRFILTEDLRGLPNTVTGITNQVAGDIVVDFTTPANSRVGTIRINARTLLTDSEFRNRAIRAEILESSSDEYEFIEFTPTAINGLPETIAVGQEISFQIIGDLKIRTIVNAVTFDVTATLTAEDRLEGTAKSQVTRAAYNLQIPNVPSVANVSDDVRLEIDFIATKVEQ